jgi:hypothetical protein
VITHIYNDKAVIADTRPIGKLCTLTHIMFVYMYRERFILYPYTVTEKIQRSRSDNFPLYSTLVVMCVRVTHRKHLRDYV